MHTSSPPPAVLTGGATAGTTAGAAPGTGAVPFSVVDAITTTHLVMIAVLAVVVVIGMIYGARLKHRRALAREEERQRLDNYDAEHRDAAAIERLPNAPPPPGVPAEPVVTGPDQERRPPPVATSPEPTTVSGNGSAAGPVTQLKGLGPKVAARLAELGIASVGQIAALDNDAADALDAQLGAFQGRIARDRWVEQARFLAAGDRAGFEAVFGRL